MSILTQTVGAAVNVRHAIVPILLAFAVLGSSGSLSAGQGTATAGTGASPQTTGTAGQTSGAPSQTSGMTAQTTGTSGQTTGSTSQTTATTANTTGSTGQTTGLTATSTGTGGQSTGSTAATTGTSGQPTGAPVQTTGSTAATTGTVGQSTGTPGQTPGITTPTLLDAASAVTGETRPASVPVPPVFGFQYFTQARVAADARRARGNTTISVNALSEAIGPEAGPGVSVSGLAPDRYLLGSGDTLDVSFSSPVMAAETFRLTIDPRGVVTIPKGRSFVLRGQTLSQAERTIRAELQRVFRDVTATVTLGALRSIPVMLMGDVYAPGTYQMPGTVTLFGALMVAGGPADSGSFRSIILRRGTIRKTIDLYRLFLKGDGTQDVPLTAGDMIIVPPSETRVTVRGEVRRPFTYELRAGETMRSALSYAGGIRPGAVAQRVLVDSIRPGVDRRLIDVNVLRAGKGDNPRLYDGDVIDVFSIRPIVTNAVKVEGAVDQPRSFAWQKGMRVSDLVAMARGVLPEASLDRADLFRKNDDGTQTLVSIRLNQALRQVPESDVLVQSGDRLVIYSLSDVRWMGNRVVTVVGSARKPGPYYRANNMTVRDLLLQSGGLQPNAFRSSAFLQRTNSDGTPGPMLTLNVGQIVDGSNADNVLLQDLDVLTIRTIEEMMAQSQRQVTISGAVQRPGQYVLASNMRLRDLFQLVGGSLPTASNRVFVQRTNEDGTPGPILTLNVSKVLANDPTENIQLAPQDRVSLYSLQQAGFQPEEVVIISGAVQAAGTFPRATNMRLGDLIRLAGSITPLAATKGFLTRVNADGSPGLLLTLDIAKALAGDPTNDVLLEPRDRFLVPTIAESGFVPEQRVEITGAVQRPGVFLRSAGMRLLDLINLAGGTLPRAFLKTIYIQRSNLNGTQGPLLTVDLAKALSGDLESNVILELNDRVSVFTIDETQFSIGATISIRGAVQRPGTFPRSSGMRLRNLVDLAGGFLPTTSDTLEISSAFAPVGTPFTRIPVMDVLTRPEANVELKDGDTVTIPGRSGIRERPRIVTILGAVSFPGPYMLSGENDRLSNLVRRAGGFTPTAFPKAAEFVRSPDLLSTPLQKRLQPELAETLRLVSDDEYRRAAALADLDRLRIVFSSGASISSSGQIVVPQIGGGGGVVGSDKNFNPGVSLDQALAQALRSEAATKARLLNEKELVPAGNLNVELDKAMKQPGGKEDVLLVDGDVIVIPEQPTTVSVTGAVIRSSSIIFVPGKPMSYYLDRSGGTTNDAELNSIVIVRATGALQRYRKGIAVEVGDNILVPTKVQSVRLREKQSEVSTIANNVTSAAVTLALIRQLGR